MMSSELEHAVLRLRDGNAFPIDSTGSHIAYLWTAPTEEAGSVAMGMYMGDFEGGLPKGHGRLELWCQEVWVGEVDGLMPHGMGQWANEDSGEVFRGEMADGSRKEGTLTLASVARAGRWDGADLIDECPIGGDVEERVARALELAEAAAECARKRSAEAARAREAARAAEALRAAAVAQAEGRFPACRERSLIKHTPASAPAFDTLTQLEEAEHEHRRTRAQHAGVTLTHLRSRACMAVISSHVTVLAAINKSGNTQNAAEASAGMAGVAGVAGAGVANAADAMDATGVAGAACDDTQGSDALGIEDLLRLRDRQTMYLAERSLSYSSMKREIKDEIAAKRVANAHAFFDMMDAMPDSIIAFLRRHRLTSAAPRVTITNTRGSAGERALGGREQAKRALRRSEKQIAEAGVRKAKADLKAAEARLAEINEREAATTAAAAT